LRAVAMGQDEIMTRADDVGQERGGRLNPAALGPRVRGLAGRLKRVPADRHDELGHPSALAGSLVLFWGIYLNVRTLEFDSRTASSMGTGITIYQEGRIASFCESREDPGAGMEPVLAVP